MFQDDNLIKKTALSGLALALTGLSRIIYNIVIGKSFNAEILGQLNLVLSIAMMLSLVVSLLTENSASKFLSEHSTECDRQGIFTLLQRWLFVGSFFLIAAAYLLRGLIFQHIEIDENLYLLGLIIVFLMAAHHFYRGCFYGLDSVENYFKLEIISSVLFFLILGLAVYVFRGNLLSPFLAYYGAFSILGAISLRGYFRPTRGYFSLTKDIGLYGIISTIGTLASTSSAYLANIFTGFYLSSEQVGLYSAAVSITSVLVFAPTVLGRVLLPTMSSSFGDGDVGNIKALLDVSTIWLSMAALFLGGIFIILSENIFVILFNENFVGAAFSLQMLILGLCLSTMVVPSVSALSGTKFVKIPNAAGVIGLLVSLALWPSLIPRFGINGTAIGYILGTTITSIIILFYSNKYYYIDLKRLFAICFKCISIFVVSITASMLLPSYQNGFASGIYIVLFAILFRKDIYDIYCKVKRYNKPQ